MDTVVESIVDIGDDVSIGEDDMKALPFTTIARPVSRPESAVSSVAEESLDVFELPASLQWLSRAASHPGAGPMEEEESDGEEPDIPVLGSAGGDGLGCLGSRASTPDSINEVQPPTAAPISAPMSGTKRAPNSQNRPKGGRSRPWFSRANQ